MEDLPREEAYRLLMRLGPIISDGLASDQVVEMMDPIVVVLLEGDEWTSPAEVLIVERLHHLHALNGCRRWGEAEAAPPDFLMVAITRGKTCLEFRVPHPHLRPDWWGLPPTGHAAALAGRFALAIRLTGRRALARVRSVLGHLRASLP